MSAMALRTPMDESVERIDWSKAIESNRRWLSTVVHSRLSDHQAAEDVLQEVALAAISQDSQPKDPTKVAPWLYRIALRKVINHHRASGRRKRLMAGALEAGLGDEISKSPGPGEWLIQMEDESAIASAMQKISSQEREILLLKYTEGWGYQDLAEHLGVSVKTVEYRLLKARQALRSKLVEFCK